MRVIIIIKRWAEREGPSGCVIGERKINQVWETESCSQGVSVGVGYNLEAIVLGFYVWHCLWLYARFGIA